MSGVQFIDQGLANFYECGRLTQPAFVLFPIRSMQIPYHVDAIFRHPGIKKLEGGRDVTHYVAPVIHDDVGYADFMDYVLQELNVLLRPDVDLDLAFFELLPIWIDIDSTNSAVRTKIAFPHL